MEREVEENRVWFLDVPSFNSLENMTCRYPEINPLYGYVFGNGTNFSGIYLLKTLAYFSCFDELQIMNNTHVIYNNCAYINLYSYKPRKKVRVKINVDYHPNITSGVAELTGFFAVKSFKVFSFDILKMSVYVSYLNLAVKNKDNLKKMLSKKFTDMYNEIKNIKRVYKA
jgi:hypothetical protein